MNLLEWCPDWRHWSLGLWTQGSSQTNASTSIQAEDEPSGHAEDENPSRLAFILAFLFAFFRNIFNCILRLCNCIPIQVVLICAVVLGAAFNGLSIPSVIFQMLNGWRIGQMAAVIQISIYIGIIFSILSGVNQLADIYRCKYWETARTIYEALQDGFSAFFFTLLGVLAIAEYFIKSASNLGFFALCLIPAVVGFGQFALGLFELDSFKAFSNRNKNRLNRLEIILDALQNGFTFQSFLTFFAIVSHILLSPTLKLIFWAFSVATAIIPISLKCRGNNPDKIDKVCDFLSGLTYFLGVLQTFQQNGKVFYSPGTAWAELAAIWGLVAIVLPLITIYNYKDKYVNTLPEKWYGNEEDHSEQGAHVNIEAPVEPSPSCCTGITGLVGSSLTKALNCGKRNGDAESEEELVPIANPETTESSWLKWRCVIS